MSKGSGGIVIRREWSKTLKKMSIEEKGTILDYVLRHVDGDLVDEPPDNLRYFIDMMCYTVDEDRANYQKTSEARSKAGKSGGEKSGEARRRKTADADSQTVGDPSLEDIEEYAKKRGNAVPAARFHDYYTVRDWKDQNGKVIQDWKSMYRKWEKTPPPDIPQERSYDIDAFAKLAMERSFEDVE